MAEMATFKSQLFLFILFFLIHYKSGSVSYFFLCREYVVPFLEDQEKHFPQWRVLPGCSVFRSRPGPFSRSDGVPGRVSHT